MFHWDEQAEDANAMSGILQLRTITRTSTMDKAGDFCDWTWEEAPEKEQHLLCIMARSGHWGCENEVGLYNYTGRYTSAAASAGYLIGWTREVFTHPMPQSDACRIQLRDEETEATEADVESQLRTSSYPSCGELRISPRLDPRRIHT